MSELQNNVTKDNIRTQLADLMSGGKATREGLRYVLKSLLLELAEGQLLDCLYENSIYKKMMKENASNYGMSPLLKSFLLVLVFGIVAMPFAGLSLILRRDSGLVTRVIGLGMLLVAIATWGYLVYYSIH